jgi:protein gp37
LRSAAAENDTITPEDAMSENSKIEWTDTTWNPVRGCTKVSPGCANCYAETFAERWRGIAGHPYEQGFDLRLAPDKLTEPLKWKKPRRVFVNSMSDLFHKDVPDEYIRRVFAVMSTAGQHTFQVLTKRADRMADWFADAENSLSMCQAEFIVADKYLEAITTPTGRRRKNDSRAINGTRLGLGDGNYWPLPNVWLGVSVEDQKRADERIPHLLRTPAAVRFLSCEPLLGQVDLSGYFGGAYVGLPGDKVIPNYNFGIDWCIVGGESGPKARPCNVDWIRAIRDQCKAASVPCFVKQLGKEPRPSALPSDQCVRFVKDSKGGDPSEWPEDLRVREFPTPATPGSE